MSAVWRGASLLVIRACMQSSGVQQVLHMTPIENKMPILFTETFTLIYFLSLKASKSLLIAWTCYTAVWFNAVCFCIAYSCFGRFIVSMHCL